MKKQLIDLAPMKDDIRAKLVEKYDSTVYMNTDTIDVRVDIKSLLEDYMSNRNLVEPTVYITGDAYVKMRHLVDKTSTEIGWFGTVTKMPNLPETYIIDDILVYPQTVSGATCEQDEDRMFEFEMSLTTDQVNRKRFQGHSHVSMGVTPSGVDENFYKDLLTQVTDYFIILVTNKRNEYHIRFYDKANNLLYTEVPIHLILDDGTEINNWYEEAEKKLSKPTTAFSVNKSITGSAAGSMLANTSKYRPSYNRAYYDGFDDDDEEWNAWYRNVNKTVEAVTGKKDKKKGKK